MLRLGIDLGGTKIEIVALTGENEELLRQRIPTPVGNYPAIVSAIAELVHHVEQQLGQQGTVGIGIPGALSSRNGLIKNANSTCLIGKPLQSDMESALKRSVRLGNDANCFALSEAKDGAGMGASIVFGAILGTGVGGGLVIHGQTLKGINSIAGEWGHNPLPPLPEPCGTTRNVPQQCYCGKMDCIECYLSGPGLVQDYLRHTPANSSRIDPPAIIAGATRGEANCEAALQRYEKRLATALAQVINILDPDVIVLGGGMSNIGRLYETIPALWQEHIFSDTVETRLVKNAHGDSSGVRGAAWLWEENGKTE